MTKRLYRSAANKVLGGVCGGMGDYFDVDPTLIRLISVVAIPATGGLAVLAYLLGWIIIPQDYYASEIPRQEPQGPEFAAASISDNRWRTFLPGIILVGIGAVLLIREYVVWFSFFDLWPIMFVLIGLVLILRNGKKRHGENGTPPDSIQPSDAAQPSRPTPPPKGDPQ